MPEESSRKIVKELLKMQPDALIEFFEIDFSNLQSDFSMLEKKHRVNISADPVYRFTSNINGTRPLYWQGKAYQPLPIDVEGLESTSDGRLPRPKLRLSNPSGILSSIVASNYDFHACRVTRKRTFAKFIDDANFPENLTTYEDVDGSKTIDRNKDINDLNPFGGQEDHNAHLPDEVYYIHRKVAENKTVLEFELTSILEVSDAKFPGRTMMSNHCSFRYRQPGTCGYGGCPIENTKGKRFAEMGILKFVTRGPWNDALNYSKGDVVTYRSDREPKINSHFVCIKDHVSPSPYPPISEEFWSLDACSKSLDSCIRRYGADATNAIGPALRFGGFPSTENFRHGSM
jgi:phage-related protein